MASAAFRIPGAAINLGAIPHNSCSTDNHQIKLTMTYNEGLDLFVRQKGPYISTAYFEKCYADALCFGEFIGRDTPIENVTDQMMTEWLRRRQTRAGEQLSPRTLANKAVHVSSMFSFLHRKGLIEASPTNGTCRRLKRRLPSRVPEILTADRARALMTDVEKNYPEWACYFAIALFAGILPGQLSKLAHAVAENGTETYFSGSVIMLPGNTAKDGKPCAVVVPRNLATWLAKYPASAERLSPGRQALGRIRKAHGLRPYSLRDTAVSAFVSSGWDFARTALQFGKSEVIIKHHYFKTMSREEAQAFYAIMPDNL